MYERERVWVGERERQKTRQTNRNSVLNPQRRKTGIDLDNVSHGKGIYT